MRLDMDLKEFCSSAISPSRLRSFLFCEAQPLVERQRHRPRTGRSTKVGSVQHQVDLSWQVERLGDLEPVEVYTVGEALAYLEDTIRVALRRGVVLANTCSVRTFASVVRELISGRGLLGYPDALDCRDGEVTVGRGVVPLVCESLMVLEAAYLPPPG